MGEPHYRPIADAYLSDAIDRVNQTHAWVVCKWQNLRCIVENARVNQGGEFRKDAADRFRDAISYRPEWLFPIIRSPGILEISVVIMNGESTCQYFKTRFHFHNEENPSFRAYSLDSVQVNVAHYEQLHEQREKAEKAERDAYWKIHPFCRG